MRTKKLLYVAAALTLLVAPAALAAATGNGLSDQGSPHNFSTEPWNFTGEICRVCHVPHDHGRDTGLIGLLWNHQVTSASYTMYSSATLDGAIDSAPTGISKMCLGCHDGSVALDEFDSNIGVPGNTFIGADDKVPNVPNSPYDLRATHPISIVYDENADGGLNPQTDPMGSSGSIADVLDNGKVQCSSCHDVHDAPGEVVPGTHLLRVAQTTSQGGDPSGLCLTCHNK